MTSEPIRAAVISDTHGLLRPEIEKIIQSCDLVIHAGDFDNQMVFHKLKIKQPLYAVRGNNDHDWAEQLPLIRRFKLGNFRFLLVHDQADIPEDLGDVQIVIFGHSHIPLEKQQDGRLWLNPGSCGYRRFTLPLSMTVLTLQDDRCRIETIFFKEDKKSREIDFFLAACGQGQVKREEDETDAVKKEEEQERPGYKKGMEAQKNAGSKKEMEVQEAPEMKKKFRDRIAQGQRQKDQLFVIAKIMRLMKRGEAVEWVAKNLRVEPVFVETVYRICVTHPQADAHQVLDKLEVNRLAYSR